MRRGFTLIELVVVLIIVAALAGLIIPQVGMLGRSSDMAVSAKTQSDLANNIQLFFVQQKRYPQGLDSLIDTTGAVYASDTTDGNTQTRGLPYLGADGTRLQDQLTVVPLTNGGGASWLRSLTRSGFEFVYDHDLTIVNSNNSGTVQRLLTAAPVNVAEVTGAYLRNKFAPLGATGTNLDPTRERIVAFGLGPNNAALGKTLLNAPVYAGNDGRYYGRYIVYFKIYASGERATLVGVSDSYGRTPDYTQQQFNESLPDGGRQG
jgi:prepilin-type N-terminal cleavage/methylation domain-containing protein